MPQLTRLADTLAAQLGHQVHLNIEIDAALVGGLTVRVGDELYDGSVAHRIAAGPPTDDRLSDEPAATDPRPCARTTPTQRAGTR